MRLHNSVSIDNQGGLPERLKGWLTRLTILGWRRWLADPFRAIFSAPPRPSSAFDSYRALFCILFGQIKSSSCWLFSIDFNKAETTESDFRKGKGSGGGGRSSYLGELRMFQEVFLGGLCSSDVRFLGGKGYLFILIQNNFIHPSPSVFLRTLLSLSSLIHGWGTLRGRPCILNFHSLIKTHSNKESQYMYIY